MEFESIDKRRDITSGSNNDFLPSQSQNHNKTSTNRSTPLDKYKFFVPDTPQAPEFRSFMTLSGLPRSSPIRGLCLKTINDDTHALQQLKKIQLDRKRTTSKQQNSNTTVSMHTALQNCTDYLSTGRYALKPVNAEEAAFPLAYSLLGYRDPEQIERLLSLIYRPQNIYCLHIDLKAAPHVFEPLKQLGRCLPNVLVVERDRIAVNWGYNSVLRAELVCMRMMDTRHLYWRYFINLTGRCIAFYIRWFVVSMIVRK